MKHLTLTLLSAGLVMAVLAGPAQAQRRGGGGGYGGYRGGWSGSGGWSGGYSGYRGGWYGGTGLYSTPYWGGGYYRPYAYNYGGYNQPYSSNYYQTPAVPSYSYSPTYAVPYDSTSMMYTAPGDTTAAQTQSYQSFYNAPAASSNQATIEVLVPQPNARVWVDDKLTQQQGTDRRFTSPTLERGREYSYTIRASWQENGREVSRQKTVTFAPGQQVAVNFMDMQGGAGNSVMPTQQGPQPSGGIAPASRPPAGGTGDDRRPDRSSTGSPPADRPTGRLSDNTDTEAPNANGQGGERQGTRNIPPPPPPKR